MKLCVGFQVCGHICRCYSVAAQFEECREKIIELPNIIRDVCHILYFSKVSVNISFFGVYLPFSMPSHTKTVLDPYLNELAVILVSGVVFSLSAGL